MQIRPLGILVFAVSLVGCGPSTPEPGTDAGAGPDTGEVETDGGTPMADGGGPGDGGALADAPSPELCTGGLDEDGDLAVDCEDQDCWSTETCIAETVSTISPGLLPCGEPIEIDEAESAEACGAMGAPDGSEYPTDCAAASMTATVRVFCDGTLAPAAVWIEERASTAYSSRMLEPRTIERVYYDRTSILDWERHSSGAGSSTGTVFPAHEDSRSGADRTLTRVITVRAAVHGDGFSRLLGMTHITERLNVDTGTGSMERIPMRTGGLTIVVP